MAEIVIQAVGVGMEEALIVSWLKQPGDAVAVDDPVAEIETDKATMDVVSPFAGTLGPHLVGAETSSRWARRSWRSSTEARCRGRTGAGRA